MKKEKVVLALALAAMMFASCSIADEKSAVSDSSLMTSAVPSGYSLVWSDQFTTAGQPNSSFRTAMSSTATAPLREIPAAGATVYRRIITKSPTVP